MHHVKMIIKNKHICPQIIIGYNSMWRYRYYVLRSRKITFVYLHQRIFVQKCAYSEITQRILLQNRGHSDWCHQWIKNCLPFCSTSVHPVLFDLLFFVQCFLDHCLSLCPFSIDHSVVCPSSIYGCGIFRPFLYVHIYFLV